MFAGKSTRIGRPSSILLPLLLLLGTLLQALPTPLTPTSLRRRDAEDSGYADTSDSKPPSNVHFTPCSSADYEIDGKVTSMDITPCERSSPSQPCTFRHGRNYTVSLGFVSHRNSSTPRSSVEAQDGPESYAYSGQSFNACKYAPCPIVAETPSTYIYKFETLRSPFNRLTFNVTDGFTGPSLFCAGTDVHFEL